LVKFTRTEERFLKTKELGRLATIAPDNMPHVVPVCYIYRAGKLRIAIDYASRKYHNLLTNDKVGFVVDVYKPSRELRGMLVQGKAKIVESGPEFREAYRLFYKKFSWVRADPWKEGDAPFIKVEPTSKASWSLG